MKDDLFLVLTCRRGNWLAHHVKAIKEVCGEVFENPYDPTMIVIPTLEHGGVDTRMIARTLGLSEAAEHLFLQHYLVRRSSLPFQVPS